MILSDPGDEVSHIEEINSIHDLNLFGVSDTDE